MNVQILNFTFFSVPFHSNSDGHRVQERRRRVEQRFLSSSSFSSSSVRSQLLIFHMKNHYLTEVILVPSAQCLISHSHILIRFTFMANVESWLVWSCCLHDGRRRQLKEKRPKDFHPRGAFHLSSSNQFPREFLRLSLPVANSFWLVFTIHFIFFLILHLHDVQLPHRKTTPTLCHLSSTFHPHSDSKCVWRWHKGLKLESLVINHPQHISSARRARLTHKCVEKPREYVINSINAALRKRFSALNHTPFSLLYGVQVLKMQ